MIENVVKFFVIIIASITLKNYFKWLIKIKFRLIVIDYDNELFDVDEFHAIMIKLMIIRPSLDFD